MRFANYLLKIEVEGGLHGWVEVYELDGQYLRTFVLHTLEKVILGVDLALLVDDDVLPVTKDNLLDCIAPEWSGWTVVESHIPELQEGDVIGVGRPDGGQSFAGT